MPIFEYQTQDGRTFEIDAPDPAAVSKIITENQSQFAPPKRGYVESFFRPWGRAIPAFGDASQETAREGLDLMKSGAQQFAASGGHPLDIMGPAKAAAGALQYVTAPLTGPVRALWSEPAADQGRQLLEAAGVPREYAEPAARVVVDTAAGLAGLKQPFRGVAPQTMGVRSEGFKIGDTPVTRGQFTRDPEQLQFERAAEAGQLGRGAQRQAQAFQAYQAPAVARQTEAVHRGLSPTGEVLAESAREGAAISQRGAQQAAAEAKQAVDIGFQQVREQSGAERGAIDVLGFRDMGTGIHQELFNSIGVPEPVLVDKNLTPEASQMIDDLNMQPRDLLRRLRIEIPPKVEPQPTQISGRAVGAYQGGVPELQGIDLTMVDQIRKWLGKLRAAAFKSGDRERMRAAAAVMEKFDQRIDLAVDSGLFRLPDGSPGDPRVLQAWKDKRALHADYKATFFKGGHADPVGRAMEQIIGRHGTEAAIPDDVADYMYGASGFAPSTLNVQLMERMRSILTPRQWAASKQGLYKRLIEPPGTLEGATQWTHAAVTKHLQRFLDSDMARVLEPHERDMLRGYADLRGRLAATEAQARLPVSEQRMGDRLAMYAAGQVAGVLGHMTHIPLAGPAMKYAAEFYVRGRAARQATARAKRDMAILGRSWTDYANAVMKYESGRTPRDIARLTIAARNFERALQDTMGTSMRALSGPETTPAQQDQQQDPSQRLPAAFSPDAQSAWQRLRPAPP